MSTHHLKFLCGLLLAPATALAQSYAIEWFTIAGGGGQSAGGQYVLNGTLGQHSAGGPMTGGPWSVHSGYWTSSTGALPCYANCDSSTVAPILNVEDFTCFINAFAAGSALPHAEQITHYANCDGSTTLPVLNVEDFICFINAFAAGCP
jgi:hypothetical protein